MLLLRAVTGAGHLLYVTYEFHYQTLFQRGGFHLMY